MKGGDVRIALLGCCVANSILRIQLSNKVRSPTKDLGS
jgi:hypothetical protein